MPSSPAWLKSVPATRFGQNSDSWENEAGRISTNTEMSASKGSTATESFVTAKVSTVDRIKKYSWQNQEVQLTELKRTVDRIKKYSRQNWEDFE